MSTVIPGTARPLRTFADGSVELEVAFNQEVYKMATLNDVFEGMRLIVKYSNTEEMKDHCVQAEHDQIWCGEYSGDKMNSSDFKRMQDFGWFLDKDSWSKFT